MDRYYVDLAVCVMEKAVKHLNEAETYLIDAKAHDYISASVRRSKNGITNMINELIDLAKMEKDQDA